jgi:hypothetical protein
VLAHPGGPRVEALGLRRGEDLPQLVVEPAPGHEVLRGLRALLGGGAQVRVGVHLGEQVRGGRRGRDRDVGVVPQVEDLGGGARGAVLEAGEQRAGVVERRVERREVGRPGAGLGGERGGLREGHAPTIATAGCVGPPVSARDRRAVSAGRPGRAAP